MNSVSIHHTCRRVRRCALFAVVCVPLSLRADCAAQAGGRVDLGLPFITGEPLTEAVKKKVYDMKVAMDNLGGKADPKVTASLIEALDDKSRFVWHMATKHLGRCLEPKKAMPALKSVLGRAESEFDTRLLPTLYYRKNAKGKMVRTPDREMHENHPVFHHCVPFLAVAVRSIASTGGLAAQGVLVDLVRRREVAETPASLFREAVTTLCEMGTAVSLGAVVDVMARQEKWVKVPAKKRVTVLHRGVFGPGMEESFALTGEDALTRTDASLRRAFATAGVKKPPRRPRKKAYASAKQWQRFLKKNAKSLPKEPRAVKSGG